MLIKLIKAFLGKNLSWRLGRALYQYSRGDIPANIDTDGEAMVQRCVVKGWTSSASKGKNLVIFDVGANVGDWALRLLECFPEAQGRALLALHMFEPVPETFRVLKERISGLARGAGCYYHQVALSSEAGTAQIHAQGKAGINSLHSDKAGEDSGSIPVIKETLARFCSEKQVGKIALLKCDTEGHDMDVIEGALPLLAAGRIEVLQFEYNHRWVYSRHYLKDAFDKISGLPYRLGKIQPEHIELYSEWHPELERFFEANYILIHENSLDLFLTEEVVFGEDNAARQAHGKSSPAVLRG